MVKVIFFFQNWEARIQYSMWSTIISYFIDAKRQDTKSAEGYLCMIDMC
jgi:hypothetical protein